MLFALGQVVATAEVAYEMERDPLFREAVWQSIACHSTGNWGDLDAEDKQANDRAVLTGDERILSSYQLPIKKIWIITEADRSATTVLFPYEY
jgi:hypothetical protein